MRGELGISRREALTLWYILYPELAERGGGNLMGFIGCIQGVAEGSRELLALNPTSKGAPQDILQLFKALENLGNNQPLPSPPQAEQSIPLFSGKLAPFLPVDPGSLDWSSRERTLSGHVVESLACEFVIHLRVSLTDEEGEAFMGVLDIDKIEEQPVVNMEGNMEVVDAGLKCRD